VLLRFFPPGTFNQNPSHRLSGSAEKVPAALPILTFRLYKSNVGFVDQSSCLERLPGPLLSHLLCGQQSQLFVD